MSNLPQVNHNSSAGRNSGPESMWAKLERIFGGSADIRFWLNMLGCFEKGDDRDTALSLHNALVNLKERYQNYARAYGELPLENFIGLKLGKKFKDGKYLDPRLIKNGQIVPNPKIESKDLDNQPWENALPDSLDLPVDPFGNYFVVESQQDESILREQILVQGNPQKDPGPGDYSSEIISRQSEYGENSLENLVHESESKQIDQRTHRGLIVSSKLEDSQTDISYTGSRTVTANGYSDNRAGSGTKSVVGFNTAEDEIAGTRIEESYTENWDVSQARNEVKNGNNKIIEVTTTQTISSSAGNVLDRQEFVDQKKFGIHEFSTTPLTSQEVALDKTKVISQSHIDETRLSNGTLQAFAEIVSVYGEFYKEKVISGGETVRVDAFKKETTTATQEGGKTLKVMEMSGIVVDEQGNPVRTANGNQATIYVVYDQSTGKYTALRGELFTTTEIIQDPIKVKNSTAIDFVSADGKTRKTLIPIESRLTILKQDAAGNLSQIVSQTVSTEKVVGGNLVAALDLTSNQGILYQENKILGGQLELVDPVTGDQDIITKAGGSWNQVVTFQGYLPDKTPNGNQASVKIWFENATGTWKMQSAVLANTEMTIAEPILDISKKTLNITKPDGTIIATLEPEIVKITTLLSDPITGKPTKIMSQTLTTQQAENGNLLAYLELTSEHGILFQKEEILGGKTKIYNPGTEETKIINKISGEWAVVTEYSGALAETTPNGEKASVMVWYDAGEKTFKMKSAVYSESVKVLGKPIIEENTISINYLGPDGEAKLSIKPEVVTNITLVKDPETGVLSQIKTQTFTAAQGSGENLTSYLQVTANSGILFQTSATKDKGIVQIVNPGKAMDIFVSSESNFKTKTSWEGVLPETVNGAAASQVEKVENGVRTIQTGVKSTSESAGTVETNLWGEIANNLISQHKIEKQIIKRTTLSTSYFSAGVAEIPDLTPQNTSYAYTLNSSTTSGNRVIFTPYEVRKESFSAVNGGEETVDSAFYKNPTIIVDRGQVYYIDKNSGLRFVGYYSHTERETPYKDLDPFAVQDHWDLTLTKRLFFSQNTIFDIYTIARGGSVTREMGVGANLNLFQEITRGTGNFELGVEFYAQRDNSGNKQLILEEGITSSEITEQSHVDYVPGWTDEITQTTLESIYQQTTELIPANAKHGRAVFILGYGQDLNYSAQSGAYRTKWKIKATHETISNVTNGGLTQLEASYSNWTKNGNSYVDTRLIYGFGEKEVKYFNAAASYYQHLNHNLDLILSGSLPLMKTQGNYPAVAGSIGLNIRVNDALALNPLWLFSSAGGEFRPGTTLNLGGLKIGAQMFGGGVIPSLSIGRGDFPLSFTLVSGKLVWNPIQLSASVLIDVISRGQLGKDLNQKIAEIDKLLKDETKNLSETDKNKLMDAKNSLKMQLAKIHPTFLLPVFGTHVDIEAARIIEELKEKVKTDNTLSPLRKGELSAQITKYERSRASHHPKFLFFGSHSKEEWNNTLALLIDADGVLNQEISSLSPAELEANLSFMAFVMLDFKNLPKSMRGKGRELKDRIEAYLATAALDVQKRLCAYLVPECLAEDVPAEAKEWITAYSQKILNMAEQTELALSFLVNSESKNIEDKKLKEQQYKLYLSFSDEVKKQVVARLIGVKIEGKETFEKLVGVEVEKLIQKA